MRPAPRRARILPLPQHDPSGGAVEQHALAVDDAMTRRHRWHWRYRLDLQNEVDRYMRDDDGLTNDERLITLGLSDLL